MYFISKYPFQVRSLSMNHSYVLYVIEGVDFILI